ncbi:hypothetical protein ACLMJK_002775 [Lecanora helva]
MCVPYIIPDSPPKKRARNGKPLAISAKRQDLSFQPALVEISPRLTYIASPKPDRSAVPPKATPQVHKPHHTSRRELLEDFAADEKTGKCEERELGKEECKVEEAATHPPQEQPKAEPVPMPISPTLNAVHGDCPALPPPEPPHSRDEPSSPLQSGVAEHPGHHHGVSSHPPPQEPPRRSSRSPHIYIRRPPPHYQENRCSRSSSSDSSISRRSFERMKRNMRVLWDRLRTLERWKEEKEREMRQERIKGELGRGRREGSMIRERRQRYRRGTEERAGRGEERWDWEGGDLGRR